jgi:gamma-glutamyl hydrolase
MATIVSTLLAAVFLCFLATVIADKNDRMPVIGILSIPIDPAADNKDVSFIDTSYVKFLQGGGSTVVPIFFNSTTEQIEEQMSYLDGVFFTGGMAKPTDFKRYFATARLLYNLVLQQKKTLWGTCLGLQSIADIASGEAEGILGNYPAMNLALSLNFTDYGVHHSQIFSHLPASFRNMFSEQALTQNWHSFGVGVPTFRKALEPKGFRIVSTNVDTNGVEFVSTFEHESAHIFAAQWHPEANQYDSSTGANIVHSMDATTAMNYIANFIAQSARSSSNTDGPDSTSYIASRRLGHQSDLPNAIENYPVRKVVSDGDTSFQYFFI